MFGNIGDPGRNNNPVMKNLIGLNVLMFAGTALLAESFDMVRFFGLFYPESDFFRPHQVVSHMFMHGSLSHIFFNMFGLWMFGRILESVWGSRRFLVYYFVTGIGAAALHTFVNYLEISSFHEAILAFQNSPSPELFDEIIAKHAPQFENQLAEFSGQWSLAPDNPGYLSMAEEYFRQAITARINVPTVGASGAVFGVLLAFGMLFPNTQLMLLFPPIPIKAKYFVIIYGAVEFFLGITNTMSNVAHFAHLGGMLFGFLLIKYWNKNSRTFY
jgi:membrane associated rhomboid family serine protease